MASLNPQASTFVPSFGTAASISSEIATNEKPPSASAADTEISSNDNMDEQDNKSKKRKRNKNKNKNQTPQEENKIKLVHKLGQACKHNQPDVGLEAYRIAKEEGVQMKPEIFNMLITLLSGLSNHILVSDEDPPITEAHSDAGYSISYYVLGIFSMHVYFSLFA